MEVLTAEAVEEVCRLNPGWSFNNGQLVRTYVFADFIESMKFVNQVASHAETAGHHPDIDIRYNKVRLALTTHDAAGLSTRDASFIATMAKW